VGAGGKVREKIRRGRRSESDKGEGGQEGGQEGPADGEELGRPGDGRGGEHMKVGYVKGGWEFDRKKVEHGDKSSNVIEKEGYL